jgi:hypothetical protein
MSRNNFVCRFGEHQIANLRTCVHIIYWRKAVSVPETNASVRGTTSSGQEAVLIGVPSDSFDGCLVLTELCLSILGMHVPDHELVIVSATG